jgi:hypothetical protein
MPRLVTLFVDCSKLRIVVSYNFEYYNCFELFVPHLRSDFFVIFFNKTFELEPDPLYYILYNPPFG